MGGGFPEGPTETAPPPPVLRPEADGFPTPHRWRGRQGTDCSTYRRRWPRRRRRFEPGNRRPGNGRDRRGARAKEITEMFRFFEPGGRRPRSSARGAEDRQKEEESPPEVHPGRAGPARVEIARQFGGGGISPFVRIIPQPATPWCRGNFLLRNALKSGDTMVSCPTLPGMFKFEPRLCRNPGFPPPPRGRSRGCRGAVPLPLPPPSTRKAPHRPPHGTSQKLGQRLLHAR